MMNFYYECKAHTPIGYAKCEKTDTVPSDYRDVSVFERVTEKMRKCFADKRIDEQYLDVSVRTESGLFKNIGRIWKDYNNSFYVIYFEGADKGLNEHKAKLTMKEIKAFYLYCANYAIAFEEKEMQRAEAV